MTDVSTPERFTVKRTPSGGAVVLLDGNRVLSGDELTADEWNDEAIHWSGVHDMTGKCARLADVALLAAQYLYSGEVETLDDVRPLCTYGDIVSGFCKSETVPGSLYCAEHTQSDPNKKGGPR